MSVVRKKASVGVPEHYFDLVEDILTNCEKFSRMKSSKTKAKYLTRALFNQVAEDVSNLNDGQQITFRLFGTFKVLTSNRSSFVNPRTGEAIENPGPRKILKFRPHGRMKSSINS